MIEWEFASKEKAMPLHPRLTDHRQALRPAQIAARQKAFDKDLAQQLSLTHHVLMMLAAGIALITLILIIFGVVIGYDLIVQGGRVFGP